MKFRAARSRLWRWPTLLMTSVLHVIWGIALIASPSAEFSTPLYPATLIHNSAAVGEFLLVSAALGFWALAQPMRSRRTLYALIPQQVILILASIAVIYSFAVSRFLDGVMRPRGFLLADHAIIPLLAIFHTAVMVKSHTGMDERGEI